jgi:hypothetical protein
MVSVLENFAHLLPLLLEAAAVVGVVVVGKRAVQFEVSENH